MSVHRSELMRSQTDALLCARRKCNGEGGVEKGRPQTVGRNEVQGYAGHAPYLRPPSAAWLPFDRRICIPRARDNQGEPLGTITSSFCLLHCCRRASVLRLPPSFVGSLLTDKGAVPRNRPSCRYSHLEALLFFAQIVCLISKCPSSV